MSVYFTEEFVRYLMEQRLALSVRGVELTAAVGSLNQAIVELNQTIKGQKEQ